MAEFLCYLVPYIAVAPRAVYTRAARDSAEPTGLSRPFLAPRSISPAPRATWQNQQAFLGHSWRRAPFLGVSFFDFHFPY
jgi:hypothetical protein